MHKMFAIVKNYNELLLPKKSWYDYVPCWDLRHRAGMKMFNKLCPKCGAYLPVDVAACDNCLFRFKESNYDKSRCKK